MLINTAVPIDAYMTGIKTYSRYVIDMGPQQPMQLNMSQFKGKMGSGQVNASKFLAAIGGEDVGVSMHFPNLVIKLEDSISVNPALYFVGGENLTYMVTIDDSSVATHKAEGGNIVFSGVKVGTTKASIKASNGEEHSFNITVRKSDGWL